MTATPVWIAAWGGAPPAGVGASPMYFSSDPAATQIQIVGYGGPGAGGTPIWIARPNDPGATAATIVAWGAGGGAGGGTATSTWSAADAANGIFTLSNGGMTATGGVGTWQTIRTSASKSSGKLYVEFNVNNIAGSPSSTNLMVGLANAGFNTAASNSFLGSALYSVGLQAGGGVLASSGFTANYGSMPGAANSDVWALAVDFGAGSIWVAQNNTWANGSNPGSGLLPIVSFVPATVGPLFAAISDLYAGAITLQSADSALKYRPPPGFQAWDGGPVTPSGSTWSAADASAATPPFTLTNGGMTVTQGLAPGWQTIRTTTSKTSGKLYVEFLAPSSGSVSASYQMFGLASSSAGIINSNLGAVAFAGGIQPNQNTGSGALVSSGFSWNAPYVPTPVPAVAYNDVWSLAVDFATGNVWLAQNNVWIGGGSPAAGTAWLMSFVPATVGALFAALSLNNSYGGTWTLQSADASLKYRPPAGFQAWDGGPVTPAGWTPASLPGLVAWYDAQDASTFTLAGSNVSQWNDKSGHSYNLTVLNTAPTKVASGINSYPAVQFQSASNNQMSANVPAGTFPAGIAVYCVATYLSGPPTYYAYPLVRDNNGTAAPLDRWTNNAGTVSSVYFGDGSTSTFRATYSLLAASGPHYHGLQYTKATDIYTDWRDGAQQTYAGAVGPGFYGDTATKVYVGARSNAGTQFNGYVGEIVACNALSDSDRRALEAYLSAKWGIAPAPSTWSAADAATNSFVLSNGGLTAKGNGPGYPTHPPAIRGTTSKTAGKLYVEFLCLTTSSGDFVDFGLASAAFPATSYLGSVNYSCGIAWNQTNVSAGFVSNGIMAFVPVVGDVFALAVDFAAGSVWLAQNNAWVSGNPATGASPIVSFTPATVGALFPAMGLATPEQWTLQPTAASQKYAPPSGFSAWG